MRRRIFFRLMLIFLLVIGIGAVGSHLILHKMSEQTLRQQVEQNLRQKTLMFAQRVENDRAHSLADVAAQAGQAVPTS